MSMKRPVSTTKKIETITKDRFFYVNSDYKTVQIRLDDILYVTGMKDYVNFYLEDGRVVNCLLNMKTLEDMLPKPEFMRVHRSHIVHMPKVTLIDRARFKFGDVFIPISETAKIAVQDYVEEHTIQS